MGLQGRDCRERDEGCGLWQKGMGGGGGGDEEGGR